MKNLIYMFLNILLVCFLFSACETLNKKSVNYNKEEFVFGVEIDRVHTLKPCTLNIFQMDSMLQADRLPQLGKWTSSVLQDEETR